MTGPEWTRRDLVATSLVLGGGLAAGGAGPEAPGAVAGPAPGPQRSLDVVLTVNGTAHRLGALTPTRPCLMSCGTTCT